MLYYQFQNYDDFKRIFGIVKHNNGVSSRYNKILLAYLKTKAVLHEAAKTGDCSLLDISDMASLKKYIYKRLEENVDGLPYKVRLINTNLNSSIYSTDEKEGMCVDGDVAKVRYVRHDGERERVYKMKAGKFVCLLIAEHPFGKLLPVQVTNWLSEEFTMDWTSYSSSLMPKNRLFVNKDFGKIYDSEECVGDFCSCMVDKEYHTFYEDYVDASAAYLENEEGKIVARCIIFNNVYDEEGNVYRYAERQYSTEGSDILKRTLIDALIRDGYIDIYKKIGAGCRDTHAIVDLEGRSLSDKTFHIKCSAQYDDTYSYQDTFIALNTGDAVAYNDEEMVYDFRLDDTNGRIRDEDEEENYDEYHEEYTTNDTVTVYVHGREMQCDEERLDDFIYVDSEYEYYHEDDVCKCPVCGEWLVKDKACYSDVTEDDYCCEDCRDKAEEEYKKENWHFSEYDNDYFKDEDEITYFMRYDPVTGKYGEVTINVETVTQLIVDKIFSMVDGVIYDKIDEITSLPYGVERKEVLYETA